MWSTTVTNLRHCIDNVFLCELKLALQRYSLYYIYYSRSYSTFYSFTAFPKHVLYAHNRHVLLPCHTFHETAATPALYLHPRLHRVPYTHRLVLGRCSTVFRATFLTSLHHAPLVHSYRNVKVDLCSSILPVEWYVTDHIHSSICFLFFYCYMMLFYYY